MIDSGVRFNRGRGALGHDVTAVLAGTRAHVDQVIGGPHHVLVVLDDQDGVALVAQPLECPDQLVVVPLVQPDGRLVEDVEHAHQAGPDLRRQADALRLAARERAGGTVEGQVADADVGKEPAAAR